MEGKIDLKPCPFCGAHDLAITYIKSILTEHKDGTFYTVEITCRECWMKIHGNCEWDEREACESAVDKWNRREYHVR